MALLCISLSIAQLIAFNLNERWFGKSDPFLYSAIASSSRPAALSKLPRLVASLPVRPPLRASDTASARCKSPCVSSPLPHFEALLLTQVVTSSSSYAVMTRLILLR